MANPSLQIGNEKWATKDGSLLGYNITDSDRYIPIPADVSRGSKATYVDSDGLIKTNEANVARIDYSSGEGVLLTEPQSRNDVTYSSDFSDSSWLKVTDGFLINSDNSVSPDGSVNCDFLEEKNALNGAKQISRVQSFVAGFSTFSAYVKPVGRQWVRLFIYDGSSFQSAYFDVLNGVVGTTPFGVVTDIKKIGDFYRCVATFPVVSGSGFSYISGATSDGGADNYIGESGKGYNIWGAQLEEQSYATSIIHTSGSVVTRNADVIGGAGDSSTFNSSEGTLYFELSTILGEDSRINIIDTSNTNNRISVVHIAGDTFINFTYRINDVVIYNKNINTDITLNHKYAFKWKINDFALYLDGVEYDVQLNGSVLSGDTLDKIHLSNRFASGNHLCGKTKDLRVYKTALSDAELIELTT